MIREGAVDSTPKKVARIFAEVLFSASHLASVLASVTIGAKIVATGEAVGFCASVSTGVSMALPLIGVAFACATVAGLVGICGDLPFSLPYETLSEKMLQIIKTYLKQEKAPAT